MKQLKNVHRPLRPPWDTLDSPFHWGFSSSALDCQTLLTLPLWNGNTKLSTLKKKTHLKHLNNSLLTKPDDKGNSLLYEGNLSPAYDQNIHLRDKFLTDCHEPPIIRRHLGMMQSRSQRPRSFWSATGIDFSSAWQKGPLGTRLGMIGMMLLMLWCWGQNGFQTSMSKWVWTNQNDQNVLWGCWTRFPVSLA